MPARRIAPPDGYESLTDAARRRGLSARTLRRQIEAGERVARPQGTALFVKIPDDAAPNAAKDGGAANDQERAIGGIDAAIAAAVAPLERRIVALDGVVAGQADTIRAQAEQLGRLAAELAAAQAALEASQRPVEARTAAETQDPSPEPPPPSDPFPAPLPPSPNAGPWWRRWLAAVYGA